MEDADRYRCRHIYLKQSDDLELQAHAACAALANLEGILFMSFIRSTRCRSNL